MKKDNGIWKEAYELKRNLPSSAVMIGYKKNGRTKDGLLCVGKFDKKLGWTITHNPHSDISEIEVKKYYIPNEERPIMCLDALLELKSWVNNE